MDSVHKGIVLHTTKYSDHKLIVKVLLGENGLKTFVVRSPKSNKSFKHQNLLQPLSLVELECVIKEAAQIHQAKNIRSGHVYNAIPFDPVKSAMVLFLDEVLHKTLPDGYVNQPLFHFLWDACILLDDAVDARNFHLWTLLEITRHFGFYPQTSPAESAYFDLQTGQFTPFKPLHRHFLADSDALCLLNLIDKEWPEVQHINLHSSTRQNLLNALVEYLLMHLENKREIQSLRILREVFHN